VEKWGGSDLKLKSDKTKEDRDMFAETYSSIINRVISFFILLLMLVFPLIYNNSYIDILVIKYQFYWGCIVVMLALCLVLSFIMLIIDYKQNEGKHAKMLVSRLQPKNWSKTFCVTDISVIIFWIILVISTFQSDYFYESFWGNEGRYSGLFLLTLYVASYFMVSRFWKASEWALDVFLISGMVVCLIGITDYFRLDILHFHIKIATEQWDIFTSTIGNINMYTAYIALVLGVAAAWFGVTKSKVRIIWCYLCMVVSFFAIIMGRSDNAYLALAALFGFLPLILFKSKTGIKRYFFMVATFGTVVQCIDFINQAYADTVIGLDSLFEVLSNFNGLMYVVIGVWVAYIVVYIWSKNNQNKDQSTPVLVYGWAGFLLLSVLAVCFLMFDANVAGNAKRYGSLGRYLVFDDSWGTNRGYIWRKSLELYGEFKPMNKLFGHGLDTFGILTNSKIKEEMPQLYENAHNEYLQYFITTGAAGLIAYVAFIGSAITRIWKRVEAKPYIIGCCFAIICYNTQAFVNISLPITSPMMWLLLSIGMASCNKRDEQI
jgi:hypothetical protein